MEFAQRWLVSIAPVLSGLLVGVAYYLGAMIGFALNVSNSLSLDSLAS